MKSNTTKTVSLLHILYLGIFLIPLVHNPFGGINPFEVSKYSFFLAYLGIAILLGVYFLLQQKTLDVSINKTVIIFALLYFCSYAISQIVSIAPLQSFWGTYERLQGTLIHFYYALHFFICFIIFKNQKTQKIFFNIIFVVGLAAAAYGLLQALGIRPFAASSATLFGSRIYSTIGNPTSFGEFLIFPIVIGGYLFYETLRSKKYASLAYGAGLLVLFVNLFLTANRASWLGLALAACILGVMYIGKKLEKKKLLLSALLVILVIALMGGFTFIANKTSGMRSLQSRFILWNAARESFQEYPFFGSGPETISERLMPHIPKELYKYESLNHVPDRTHNEFIDILLTSGIFGGFLYLAQIIFLAWFILRRSAASPPYIRAVCFGLIAYTVSMQFGFPMTANSVIALAFWAILIRHAFVWREQKAEFHIISKVVLTLVLVIVSIFSFKEAYARLRGDILFGKAVGAYLENENESFNMFQKTIQQNSQFLYPYQSFFQLFQDSVREGRFSRDLFFGYAQSALYVSPQHFQSRSMMARALFLNGDVDRAEEEFTALTQDVPNWPYGWYMWGSEEFNRQRYGKAVYALERLREIAPRYQEWDPERYRIFKISNFFFFDGMDLLRKSYAAVGQMQN